MGDDEFTEFDPGDPGNIEVGRRLEAYAETRLSPSADAMTRTRAAVMSAAHRQAALRDADTAAAVSAATSDEAARGPSLGVRRRTLVAVGAVVLTVAVVVAATKGTDPGAPFYPTRVAVEAANLPGDLAARASAQITRLEERIREVRQSSAAGDGPGAQAALTTYTTILVDTEAGANGDPRATTVIVVNVKQFVVALDELAATVPAQARPALTDAQAMSKTVLSHLTGAQ